ncbi:aldo/keto reductase [Halorussus salilacus]|uniref:aldo/keto reductase n=1 Tax=Halorussus salilacus TaxID=2953750 RepID=UPI00209DD7AD|nr:aldo/keto reductase [Halorussus salilacus]USZ69004.1 aldo/keto reductase [Halorussus salilacus]
MTTTEHDDEATPNGIPRLGLGTWQNTDPDECAESVRTALETGYRHIDTAQAYDNEEHVGEGIARSDVDREDVFLATKIWLSNLSGDDVLSTAEESLDRLGVDYVDLLYVHWPAREYDPEDTLPAFDELRERGLVRNVGVSNFEPEHLDEAREILDSPIVANQVECHPLLPQDELVAYGRDHDVDLVAYSPLARGAVFDVPEIREVAEKHDASPAQVSLAWLFQRDGVAAIPKATGGDHIRDNYGALDVELDDEDVAKIDGIDERNREVDPDFAPWS